MKYKTIAIDSASEWARLTFSYDMKKHANNFLPGKEMLRAINNYNGATERVNMVVRRMKDYRRHGINVVITAHEQLERVYAKGGSITPRGQTPQEPIAVKGWPDLPGTVCPTEVMRACDNVFRVRRVNGKPMWVGRPESVGGGGDDWEVKDRFNAPVISSGLLPSSYQELEILAKANPLCNWEPPYVFLIYGPPGIGKTRSLLSFPRPMWIADIDSGLGSISKEIRESNGQIVSESFDPEECDDYGKFISALEAAAAEN